MAHRRDQRIGPVLDRIADTRPVGVPGHSAHTTLHVEKSPHVERGPERQEVRQQPILRRAVATSEVFELFRDRQNFLASAATQMPMPAAIEDAQALRWTAHRLAQLEGPLVVLERSLRRWPLAVAQRRAKRQAHIELSPAPSIVLRPQRHDRERRLEVCDRLAIREPLPCAYGGGDQVVDGPRIVTTTLEVNGKPGGDLEPPRPVRRLESLADALVHPQALPFGDLSVDDLPVQVVAEGVPSRQTTVGPFDVPDSPQEPAATHEDLAPLLGVRLFMAERRRDDDG